MACNWWHADLRTPVLEIGQFDPKSVVVIMRKWGGRLEPGGTFNTLVNTTLKATQVDHRGAAIRGPGPDKMCQRLASSEMS